MLFVGRGVSLNGAITFLQKKRDVMLLSFFLGMSDTEIARIMRVVNSTIHEHKKKALKLMKSELEKRGMEE